MRPGRINDVLTWFTLGLLAGVILSAAACEPSRQLPESQPEVVVLA